MAKINMDSLPNEKAFGTVIPKGTYHARINKAIMKQGNDTSKPPYFTAECDITDIASGTSMGKFWINLFESEANLCRYQLRRFIEACGLNIKGEFELKDLTKMVVGREILVDIKPEDRKDGGNPTKSVIDIDAQCFYPVELTPVEEAPDAPFLAAAGTLIPQTPAPTIQANY